MIGDLDMTYADRTAAAQEEQLDWLHEIHEELQEQTRLLQGINRTAGLVHVLAIVWIVLMVIGAIIYVMTV